MKISTFVLILFSTSSLYAMTKEWTVTRLHLDEKTRIYQVDFKNQAGVYKAEEKHFSCLHESLKEKKNIQVSFNPMGLQITSCEKAPVK